MTEKKQSCPRRLTEPGPWEREEGKDRWLKRGGLTGQDAVGESCSFCGSLHPDRFMELVREGWVVIPTDKSYKAYLGRAVTAEEVAAAKARWMETPVAEAVRAQAARDGKNPEEVTAVLDETWQTVGAPFTENSHSQEAKFYYKHLSEDQQREFIALYNSHVMQLGYPGSFYRMPFFCKQAGPAEPADGD